MKMLNKKGFTLVETLIVTAFVMTLFLVVYQNMVPLLGEYKKMNSYDDIDSIYVSNLYKQSLLRYGNLDYIDLYLASNTYLDINNCQDSNIYKNSNYCLKLKNTLSISDEDYIFITKYNISEFRQEVNSNEYFDTGNLNNFRDYLKTVSDTEKFYDDSSNDKLVGKYRLFIVRNVANSDNSTSLRYVNIGIYSGKYDKYNMGEEIIFNPGDGDRKFYVLKNSSSEEDTVTLILADNLPSNSAFNSTGTTGLPNTILNILKSSTNNWVNTKTLTSADNYTVSNNYTIQYNGYQARLPEPSDFYEALYCKNDDICFDTGNLFAKYFDSDTAKFIASGLNDTNGYWLASTVLNNNEMAWSVRKDRLEPAMINNNSLGVRPVVIVSKDKLKG